VGGDCHELGNRDADHGGGGRMDYRTVADLAITRGKVRFSKGKRKGTLPHAWLLAGSPVHLASHPMKVLCLFTKLDFARPRHTSAAAYFSPDGMQWGCFHAEQEARRDPQEGGARLERMA
jgi:hypothetical protein